ncbi:UDP-3-O-[3-hydroxymyristoyl] glucosamine N-acyltransferase [Devosia enhydra]|uniref:UDP-3-O-acylglucosamine N-acyltransferase n=1 Tax=Devosia enhydra TaxID=665118 RepID=A0A1K2HUF6_9HYPH|nr:UDP-3-O-(3-hydroxymyristoyl)glucosamine N-acyltransferase [Devosia enhydra]SFZ82050.1 UDP-3-O-[3-hydroxymyristoyl] glucosamine N-acyltransferase [Devosia enhydra]
MVDIRFHHTAGPLALADLMADVGYVSDRRLPQLEVAGAAELDEADAQTIVLAAGKPYRDGLRHTRAGVAIVSPELSVDVPEGTFAIVDTRPHLLFSAILERLYPGNTRAVQLRALNPGAEGEIIIERGVSIGANVVIGAGAEIGRGTIIGANTVIGAGVAIGRDCVIGANCTIECAYLGNGVVLQSGVRIGQEGFGWLDHGRGNRKIPQLGRVIIQDRVEIGANSTVDRGALGDTVIGDGTKIDNLVQVGHNCRIGRLCLIAAKAGLAGGSILGDGVLLGGGAGLAGHLTIGSGSIVYAGAGVTKSWPEGSKIIGAPAREIREFWKEAATIRRLMKGERP